MKRRRSWIQKGALKNIERAGEMVEMGMSSTKIAAEIGVCERTARRYVEIIKGAKKDDESEVL